MTALLRLILAVIGFAAALAVAGVFVFGVAIALAVAVPLGLILLWIVGARRRRQMRPGGVVIEQVEYREVPPDARRDDR